MINNEHRVKLIEKIFELTKGSQSSAQNDAVEAIRKPTEENTTRAKISVSRSDNMFWMAQQVSDLINNYWPREVE